MTVSDGRFASVEARVGRRTDDVQLTGLVLPGLANAHSHVFQRALRGRTQTADTFIGWRTRMYDIADRMTPELYLALGRAVFAEMAMAGYTVVGEFHYLHHAPGGARYADPNAMGAALVQAAADVGLRLTLLDVVYLKGGLTADGHLPATGVQARFSDGSVDAWAERMDRMDQTEVLRRGAAIHSLRTVPREDAARVAQIVGDRPLHGYVSEQQAENLACQMFYGASPTEVLADAGVLGQEFSAVHATHVHDGDIELLAEAGAQAVVCPTSEQDQADGIGPVRKLLDAGVPVGLGSDTQAVVDPFVEVREIEMHERLLASERGRIRPAQLLRCAAQHGYQSLGWYDGGAIAPGLLADFVVVDLDSVRTAGSKPAEALLTATAADVRTVVVGGRPIVEEGRHHFGPVAPLLREALALIRERTPERV
jgi:formiminoglutamate deiminase